MHDKMRDPKGLGIVALDGACPNQQTDVRLRRVDSGLFLAINTVATVQGATAAWAQRELRTAVRWASWSWTKSVQWADSAMVSRGVTKILEGGEISGKAKRYALCFRLQYAIQAKWGWNTLQCARFRPTGPESLVSLTNIEKRSAGTIRRTASQSTEQ